MYLAFSKSYPQDHNKELMTPSTTLPSLNYNEPSLKKCLHETKKLMPRKASQVKGNSKRIRISLSSMDKKSATRQERNVRDLVASPFTKRIRDYVMPDGLKVPSNLKSYDGLSDSDDHLTMFIRTMDKTQAEILDIRQKSEESLKDYLARFGKEALHMTDRSDGMMIGAFISGLRPGRPFKDLIARPPMSLEDLYIHVNGCIRADEANNANRLRN
ncbi:gag protein [Artemisia annua]|uniref:Gag protein n=1 Tax=Artemisia annua TaxID=35608 RepID=A0A2U1NL38_ARTAN|nr:gag protein [Artemisia annua]